MLLLHPLEIISPYENTEENNEDDGEEDEDNEATKHARRTTWQTTNSFVGFPFASKQVARRPSSCTIHDVFKNNHDYYCYY